MNSNTQIISAAVSRYISFPPRRLVTLAEVGIDIPTPAHVNLPSVDELSDLILRGAEFGSNSMDHIKLEQ
jgi:hypothetical protein